MFPRGVFFLIYILVEPWSVLAESVWIDADPACGVGVTQDVDDCWAIVSAVRSSALQIAGISTVFGNVSVDQSTQSAIALLNLLYALEPGRARPAVARGADRPLREAPGLPPAVLALEHALADSSATILALGPLTNIALLLRAHPELARRVTAIVAVAGQRPGQRFRVGTHPILHFHDMNVRKDPDAVEIVLHSGIPLILVPFEVGQQVSLSQETLHALRERTPVEAWLVDDAERWRAFSEDTLGASGLIPFDLLAVGFLRIPEHFVCRPIPAKLVRRHGLFVVRDTLEVSTRFEGQPIVQYCTEISDALRRAPDTLLNIN